MLFVPSQSAMLNNWLDKTKENKVPMFASHQVGVAGLVINDLGEVLVIKEKTGPAGVLGRYKLPGGLADLGEDFGVTACREVWEETGVQCEYKSVVAFRHLHAVTTFGRSDIYVICRLVPLTSAIVMDTAEISVCEWMPLRRFASLSVEKGEIHEMNLHIARLASAAYFKDMPAARAHWDCDIVLSEFVSSVNNKQFALYHIPFASPLSK